MIELKEFNPQCMTERNKSRATQENENYSVLQTNNESELSNMLITLSSRVDIVTNVEQAKTMILTDTRKDLDELISQISGQSQTVDAIRLKQEELENTISGFFEAKKRYSETNNNTLIEEINTLKARINELNLEIKNFNRISKILSRTVQEEEAENTQHQVEQIEELLKDSALKNRLLTLLKSSVVAQIIPLNQDSINQLIAELESDNFKTSTFVNKLKTSLINCESNFVGKYEFLKNAKDNIHLFIIKILQIDAVASAESTLEQVTELASIFKEDMIALYEQDEIETRILRNQLTHINNKISRLNPEARPFTLNQMRKLSNLPLRDIESFCNANINNPSCIILKRIIDRNKHQLIQGLIDKVRSDDRYNNNERVREKLIQKIQTGAIELNELKLSVLLAFLNDSSSEEYYSQMLGRTVYYSYNATKIIPGIINGATLASERVRIEVKKLGFKVMNAEKVNGLFNQLEDAGKKLLQVNDAGNRKNLKELIQKSALCKLKIQEQLKTLKRNPKVNKIKIEQLNSHLITLQEKISRSFKIKYASIGDYLERGRRGQGIGRNLDKLSSQAGRIRRVGGLAMEGTFKAARWGVFNGALMGIPEVISAIKGNCSPSEAIKNTASNMRYCIPLWGTWLSFRDAAKHPGQPLRWVQAFASAALDVAGIPLKVAGLAARLGFGLVKTTTTNTILRGVQSYAGKIMLSSVGASLMYDLMSNSEIGTGGQAALEASYQVLGIVNQADNYLDQTPFQRLEARVLDEIDTQIQTIREYENPTLPRVET